MSDPYADREALADRRGWTPVRGGSTCPRVLAGLRCAAWKHECICQRHRHLLDHAEPWRDRDGTRLLTGEPYDLEAADLAAFDDELADLGLRLRVSGRALWHPACVLLTIRKLEA